MSELEPWIEFKDIWPTKSAFFTWLRSGLRKSIWQFYPPKLQFKNSQTYKPSPEYTGRAKKLVKCYLTGEEIPVSYAEIDHVQGNVSLKDWDDLLPFIRHLCASKENMAIVSKEAHKIKSYSEKMGISFDEALIAKSVIAICKAGKDKQWLIDRGITPLGNAKLRRQQITEEMME